MEAEDDLIVLQQAGLFQWTQWDASEPVRGPGATGVGSGPGQGQELAKQWAELGPGRANTTQPLRIYGDMGPFNFQTASDWFDRYHQYRQEFNDRRNDPVNFKNELTTGNV